MPKAKVIKILTTCLEGDAAPNPHVMHEKQRKALFQAMIKAIKNTEPKKENKQKFFSIKD
jgi:hypothetical protein